MSGENRGLSPIVPYLEGIDVVHEESDPGPFNCSRRAAEQLTLKNKKELLGCSIGRRYQNSETQKGLLIVEIYEYHPCRQTQFRCVLNIQ